MISIPSVCAVLFLERWITVGILVEIRVFLVLGKVVIYKTDLNKT